MHKDLLDVLEAHPDAYFQVFYQWALYYGCRRQAIAKIWECDTLDQR